MAVLAASDSEHVAYLEQHIIHCVNAEGQSMLRNKSRGGERIRDKFGYVYVCYSMVEDKAQW